MTESGTTPKSRAAAERDWTKGSIVHNLLILSWPMIVANTLNMLGPTVDMVWVGRLGPTAIAGVGVATMSVMVVHSMLMGLFTGLRALVARAVGAGDKDGAIHTARQAFVVAAGMSLLIALIGIFFAEPILSLVSDDKDVIAQGTTYLRISFIGTGAFVFRMMADNTMQASGDAITPMKIAFFFRLFHVVLCPFLVFGWWLFPQLGVAGAALTNVLSQSLGTILGLWFLFTGRSHLQLTLRHFHLDPATMWRLIKVGIPASVMGMQNNLGQFVLMFFMRPFGTLAVASHSLAQRVDMILFMPTWGLGIAAGVLAGQNLGAGQPERAEQGGWRAVSLGVAFMGTCALALLLWAENVVHIFSSAPALEAIASDFLRIAAAGYLVMGFSFVLQSCVSGAGDTLMPMLVGLLSMWAIQIPLAFVLPRVTGLGVYGVRWAMVAGFAVSAIAFIIYFRMGRWKHRRV